MCHMFPLSLKSITLKWFQSLPLRSINLWLNLREKFRSSFATNKERPKTVVDVRLIRQGPDESLKEYISRFNKEARSVGNIQTRCSVDAGKGWCEGMIFFYISLKNLTRYFVWVPNTWEKKYINYENDLEAKKLKLARNQNAQKVIA